MAAFSLDSFLMYLVDDWEQDRRRYPEQELKPAFEVLRPLWDLSESHGISPFNLHVRSNSFTIAEVIRMAVGEYYGSVYWYAMERYVSALSEEARRRIDLEQFAGAMLGVCEGAGNPWGDDEEEADEDE